jgi:apolipoprotein N-acyltransferase
MVMIFTLKPIRSFINLRPQIAVFLAGILCGLAQAPIFFMVGLVGFSVLVYLIYDSVSVKEAVKRNIAFSFGYFGYGFYWTAIAISVYIEDFWWMIPIALIGLPLIFCFFTSLITICVWHFRHHIHYVMIYTILWLLMEWVTSWIFTGLPWMLVGYSVGFSDILSQTATIAGVWGLSFILFNSSSIFYYIWKQDENIVRRADIYYFIMIFAIISLYGVWRLNQYPLNFSDTRIRIVQPSIPLSQKWDVDIFWQNLDLYSRLSLVNTPIKPDIIIWSEAAVVAPYQIEPVNLYLSELARKANATLITGAVSSKNDKYYTSLIAIGPKGELLFEYNKMHLVPFGEYVPLRKFIPTTFKKLTHGLEDYSPGTTEKIFSIDKPKVKIRPMICYESIFADEVITLGSDLFVNITNSSWYGNSTASYHLFYVNKFRAIENATPVIVSANTGISGIFDSVGRIIGKTKINDITTLDMYAPQKISDTTPYSRWGLNTLLIIMVFLHQLRIISNKLR